MRQEGMRRGQLSAQRGSAEYTPARCSTDHHAIERGRVRSLGNRQGRGLAWV
jgi:hypothetical protein